MPKALTKEEFIKRARIIHGDKYDYSLVDYVNSQVKVKIRCKTCGRVFEQIPNNHLNGKHGCRFCGNKNKTFTKEEFVKRAKVAHGDKYDYSLADYMNSQTKIEIVCPEHGAFWQVPNSHLQGCGCMRCARKNFGSYHKLAKEEFIKRAREIHGNKYDYSLVDYVNSQTKVKIICPIHGEFWQRPALHCSRKDGCPSCHESIGEKTVSFWLRRHNIFFERNKRFPETGKLSYDFYLPERDILIEYNGEQHYRPIGWFGGVKQLQVQQEHDERKREYAKKSGMRFIEIKYCDDVDKILTERIL